MEPDDDDDDEKRGRFASIARIAVPVVVVAGLAYGVWSLMNSTGSTRREAPPLPTLQAVLPPPPPPPPPPKEKPPPEEKKVEEEKTPAPQPKEMDAPKPVTINGPAQAGTDAFGLGAGDGSGSGIGNGTGSESYSRYVTSLLQNAIEQDERLNHLAFTAQISAKIDADRRLHVRILKSSGDSKIDSDIVSAAEQVNLDEEPPGTVELRMAIHSKRPA